MVLPSLYSPITHFDDDASVHARMPNDARAKVMPKSMAQRMLAKLMMPMQMLDASAALMSELTSDALMVTLLLMTMSKMARCILMTDV